jgi:hypothetical protein
MESALAPMTCLAPKKQSGNMSIKLEIKAYDPCPIHCGVPCECEKPLVGQICKEDDLATKQFAQFVQALILASTQSITDISSVAHSVANASATTAPTIVAGTGATAATVLDVALQTQTELIAATVNAYSGAGLTGTFTVTGTITAGAARAYVEVGLQVTNATFIYLICRDTFSVLNVSSAGTLAVTYTFTIG